MNRAIPKFSDWVNALPKYWLTRVYLALSVIVLTATALFQPNSQLYKLLNTSGNDGGFFVSVLLTLGFVALADVVVNDLMPARFRFKTAFRWRFAIYAVIAMLSLQMSYMFFAISINATGSYLQLLLNCLVAITTSLLDILARPKR